MDFLKNIGVNLRATGPAAVIIVYFICITVLGIFGQGILAGAAMVLLYIYGVLIAFLFGRKS
jgi:hypothetical protein